MNVTVTASKRNSQRASRWFVGAFGACLFIVPAMAGLLALSSCATSREGLAREERLMLGMSNAVVAVRAATPFIPQPASGTIEALLAAATAGLAAWGTHLHRSIATLNQDEAQRSRPKKPRA